MAKKYGGSLNTPVGRFVNATTPGGTRISRVTGNHVSGGGAQTMNNGMPEKGPGTRPYQGTKSN